MLPLFFFGGYVTWQITEYLAHRFVYHLEPDGTRPWLIRLHFSFHGIHHKAPFDPYHMVMPPFPAIFVGLAVYALHNMLLTPALVDGWYAGFLIGYVGYEVTHYYLHHGHPHPDSYFGRLKKFHIRHHYIDHNNGFGVSSSFFDIPFGTYFKNEKNE